MQLTEDEQDTVTEIINMGVGCATASLSDLLNLPIQMRVPSVTVWEANELSLKLTNDEVGINLSVLQNFSGGLVGKALLAFPRKSAIELARILNEPVSESKGLSAELTGMLEEIGNIVLNGVLGTIGNITESSMKYSVPRLAMGDEVTQMQAEFSSDDSDQMVVLADTRFDVQDRDVNATLILLFDGDTLDAILKTPSLSSEAI